LPSSPQRRTRRSDGLKSASQLTAWLATRRAKVERVATLWEKVERVLRLWQKVERVARLTGQSEYYSFQMSFFWGTYLACFVTHCIPAIGCLYEMGLRCGMRCIYKEG
jgi:hypothetical protein